MTVPFVNYFFGKDSSNTVKMMQAIPTKSGKTSLVLSNKTTAIIEANGSAQEMRLALVEPTIFKPAKYSA